jgi:hypothetical protein
LPPGNIEQIHRALARRNRGVRYAARVIEDEAGLSLLMTILAHYSVVARQHNNEFIVIRMDVCPQTRCSPGAVAPHAHKIQTRFHCRQE